MIKTNNSNRATLSKLWWVSPMDWTSCRWTIAKWLSSLPPSFSRPTDPSSTTSKLSHHTRSAWPTLSDYRYVFDSHFKANKFKPSWTECNFLLQLLRNHASDPNLINAALQKVRELRNIGHRHQLQLDWYRRRWSALVQLPPLFAEMFDIPRSEEDLALN